MASVKRKPPPSRPTGPAKKPKLAQKEAGRNGVKSTEVQPKLPTPSSSDSEISDSDGIDEISEASEDNVKMKNSTGPPPRKPVQHKPTSQYTAEADSAKTTVLNGKFIPSRDNSQAANNDIGTSSREAHAKQKALVQERRAAKPNADSIARGKKLWERLRRKSHVPKAERDELVKELFEIVTGHVREYVFKHDTVRIVQCALKYASPPQRHQMATELKGSYRELAESRYGKFLIAKMIVGDDEARDTIIPEFYGHVKRFMRHSEASWIMDDIYRTLATEQQKARLLREWYGPEFVVFSSGKETAAKDEVTADLSKILEMNPEKRGPIMQHLKEMTNQLVQKKTTGFTILHDAMLQYFLNTKPGSPEATEFLDMLRDDEGGDCLKNLAFTRSGSRLVCLAFAYGSSKDRRTLLKVFKTHIKLLASDVWGHQVLLAAYEVIDDTVMLSKAIFPELLSKDMTAEERQDELLGQVQHKYGRIPILYSLSNPPPKWLLVGDDVQILEELKAIRTITSKKNPETRRTELVQAISEPLLEVVASKAEVLVQTSFGCQFIAEVIFGATGDKDAALSSIAKLARMEDGPDLDTPGAGRLLKSLIQGGPFDPKLKQVQTVEPPLNFDNKLHQTLGKDFETVFCRWAFGANSFAVLAILESGTFEHRAALVGVLKQAVEAYDGDIEKNLESNAGLKLIHAHLYTKGSK